MDKMDLFGGENFAKYELLEEKYLREMLEAGNDGEKMSAVQKKYEPYFSQLAEIVTRRHPKHEKTEIKFDKDRIYLTQLNKTMLRVSILELENAGKLDRVCSTNDCICCGKHIQGLALSVACDNSSICFDCTDEENYVDFKTIKLINVEVA